MEALNDIIADSKGRINLGSQHAGERYIITKDADGEIVLQKAVVIPERELWLHKNKQAKQAVEEGLEQAKRGKVKKNVINLDSFE